MGRLNMKNKGILKYTALIIAISANLYAASVQKLYNRSLDKWNSSGIKEYYIKISFSAHSPIAGIWELNVKDGRVLNCIYNGKNADSNIKSAEMFTMENIYKTAGEGMTVDESAPSVIKILYGKNGFIRLVSRAKNPEYKGNIKKDNSYTIEILSIVPAGR